MRKASVGMAPEGYPFIILLAMSAIVFALIKWKCLALICLGLLWLAGHFFRDPERVVPSAPGVAASPADGKVIKIERRTNPFGDGEATCISVFMNLFNVHVNRSPVKGTVKDILYIPGAFFNASFDKASKDNERCVWRIQSDEGDTWDMVQIAGLVARRIVPRAEVGDELARGERYGMIRFGSRVDLYLPATYEPTVAIGDAVHAGETIMATRRNA